MHLGNYTCELNDTTFLDLTLHSGYFCSDALATLAMRRRAALTLCEWTTPVRCRDARAAAAAACGGVELMRSAQAAYTALCMFA